MSFYKKDTHVEDAQPILEYAEGSWMRSKHPRRHVMWSCVLVYQKAWPYEGSGAVAFRVHATQMHWEQFGLSSSRSHRASRALLRIKESAGGVLVLVLTRKPQQLHFGLLDALTPSVDHGTFLCQGPEKGSPETLAVLCYSGFLLD